MIDEREFADSTPAEIPTDQLRAQLLREIPRQFKRAAQVLQFDEILASHLKYAFSSLGRSALAKELIPKGDREKISTSFTEIDELRSLINSGEIPQFDGIHDI